MSEKSDFRSEYREMSSVEFVQYALRDRVAPPSVGSTKARLRHVQRQLGWSASRAKDAWYADPRISINADELRQIEEAAGVRYGRQEIREIDAYIARADALLDGPEADFYRPFVAAFRAFHRALARPGTEG